MEFIISQKAWDTMQQYAGIAHSKDGNEISGMLIVKKAKHPVTNDDVFELCEPSILKQENTGTSTELDADSLRKYYIETVKKHGSDIRYCWWHSHHTMDAFWSGTDIKAIKEYDEGDFSFALVVNLKGEYKFRVSVWNPVEAHQDVELEVIRPARCTKAMSKEVEELCNKSIPTYQNGNYSYRAGQGWKMPEEKGEKRQERIPFHSTAGLMAMSGKGETKKISYSELVDVVEEMHDDLAQGVSDYKQYKQDFDELSKELEREESLFTIKLIPESDFHAVYTTLPADCVLYKLTGEIVNDLVYINDEYDEYNNVYGGY